MTSPAAAAHSCICFAASLSLALNRDHIRHGQDEAVIVVLISEQIVHHCFYLVTKFKYLRKRGFPELGIFKRKILKR